jgi:uncharacterized membrane protein
MTSIQYRCRVNLLICGIYRVVKLLEERGHMGTKSFSIGNAIRFGWETFKKYPWFFIIAAFLAIVIPSQIRVELAPGEPISPEVGLLGSVIGIISFLVNTFITMGIFNVSLKFADGQRGEAADFFSAYPLYFIFLGASILYGIAVTIGTILFIIPGIILAVRLQFFGFFVLDQGAGVTEALRRSWEATRGVGWSVFVFDLALLGIIILGALALGVGLLIAIPITWLALAYVYRRLQPETVSAAAAA